MMETYLTGGIRPKNNTSIKREFYWRFSPLIALFYGLVPGRVFAAKEGGEKDGLLQLLLGPYLLWVIIALVGLLFLLTAVHFFAVGPKSFSHKGEKVKYFSIFTRFIHLVGILSCTVLIFTGMAIIYSGTSGFGDGLAGTDQIRQIRRIHGLSAIFFGSAVFLMFVIWVRWMLPHKADIQWLRTFGGYLSKTKQPVSAHKFNAGQKFWFWLITIGGLSMCATGLAIYLLWGGIEFLNTMAFIHNLLAVAIVAMYLIHAYMTLTAIKGAWRSMITGHKSEEEVALMHSSYYEELTSTPPPRPASAVIAKTEPKKSKPVVVAKQKQPQQAKNKKRKPKRSRALAS